MIRRIRVRVATAAISGLAVVALIASATIAQARPTIRPASASISGGSVSSILNELPDCLDPQKTVTGSSGFVLDNIVDTLVSQDYKGYFRPDLATTWSFSHGGTWVTFKLRHGVRFSNGDPFTAGAVKYTFDRAVKPSTKSPFAGGQLAPVKNTVVINRYTVRLVLKAPYRPLLSNLSGGFLGILDPKATTAEGRKSCTDPIGTGPFKVGSVGPGFSTVTLVRNPLHTWEPPWLFNHGPARLQQIVFKTITSASTATSELLTGEADIAVIESAQLGRVQGNPNIKLHTSLSQEATFLNFNESRPPFNNPAVRRAVAEAISRPGLIKAVLNGHGVPAYAPIGVTVPFYPKNAKSFAPRYNPTDAAKIIRANHATGPYTLMTFNNPMFETAVELIQGELAQVGMTVKAQPMPIASESAACAEGKCDMDLDDWGWPDADIMYSFLASTEATSTGANYSFLPKHSSKIIDALLGKGRTTVKSAGAAKAYAKLVRYLDQNAILDPLWDPVTLAAVRSRVKGWHTNAAGVIQYSDLYVRK